MTKTNIVLAILIAAALGAWGGSVLTEKHYKSIAENADTTAVVSTIETVDSISVADTLAVEDSVSTIQ